MATVVLVADNDSCRFAAGVDDRVLWEPLQPDHDVLDSEIRHAFADVGSHAASITAGQMFSAGGPRDFNGRPGCREGRAGVTALFAPVFH